MNRDAMLAKLKRAMQQSVARDVNWTAVTMETPIATLGFDSLTILDLIYEMQQMFGLEFEAEELARVKTVGELVDFLEQKQNKT